MGSRMTGVSSGVSSTGSSVIMRSSISVVSDSQNLRLQAERVRRSRGVRRRSFFIHKIFKRISAAFFHILEREAMKEENELFSRSNVTLEEYQIQLYFLSFLQNGITLLPLFDKNSMVLLHCLQDPKNLPSLIYLL